MYGSFPLCQHAYTMSATFLTEITPARSAAFPLLIAFGYFLFIKSPFPLWL